MSDDTTAEATPDEQIDSAPGDESKTFDAEYVRKLRDEAAKYRTQAKANADAATRLAEIEEANKSETQKLAERAEAAEKALADAQAEALRSRVLAAHAIPAEYHEFVVGDSEEELAARAEKVAKLIEAQSESAVTKHVTVPAEGRTPALALNGDGIESALRNALGI